MVNTILNEQGITPNEPTPKPIGCEKCKTDEYARGVCKACYTRWLRYGKPECDAVRQTKAKTGKKTLKPIGCDRCKTEPYSRGWCKRCYLRWYFRNRNKK